MSDVKFEENAMRRLAEGLLMVLVLGDTACGGAGPSPFATTQHGLLRNGRPFFWLGDTGWMLMRLSPADVECYLEDRAAKHFTVIQMMAIRTNHTVGSPTQRDLIPSYAKALPFSKLDPVTLNEAYWRHIDFILDAADDRGLTIALATMWGRDADSLFPHPLENNERYGTLLGRRYRNRDNLVWLVTGEYEKIEDDWRQPTSSAWKCRYEGYWSVFSGAFGFTYGADRVWQFHLEWEDALQYEGAADMQHLRSLIESRPMENRVPDESILVSGRGDPRKGPSYCAATRASDGRYAMVYSTMGEPFTLDLSALSGERLHGWWYSPRDGRCYSEQRQQTHRPFEIIRVQGQREFTPPTSGLNQDWVLVLDDADCRFPAPGVGLGAESGGATGAVVPGKQWQEATPESQDIDSAQLKAAAEDLKVPQLVVVRNGYLIRKGSDASAYHEIYSSTKVFTSTCLGLMLDDRKCRLDDPMVKYLPEWGRAYPAYAKVTLRHLASMRGGTRGKLGFVGKGQKWGDPVVYVTTPDKPAFAPAGSQIAYQDSHVHLLGRIVAMHLAHEPLKDLFKRRIADPIGMSRWDWGISGTVDGVTHYNAAGNGIRSDGKRRWPSAPAGTYAAQGGGSNRFYVIPEWNMVVVTLGSSDPDAQIGQSIDGFFAKIAAAFTSPPQSRLFLRARSTPIHRDL